MSETDRQDADGGTATRSWRQAAANAVAGVVAIAIVVVFVMWLGSVSPGSSDSESRDEVSSDEFDLASLTESNTHAKLDEAPQDQAGLASSEGFVVHPDKMVPVYDAPDGEPFAKVGPEQFGDTWLPVIEGTHESDWVRVLLASKPNGSTGWLRTEGLEFAHSPYEIRVHLASMRLDLYESGRVVDSWTIGIGKPNAPTPVGRTFLLGQWSNLDEFPYSPVIIGLGAHSPVLEEYLGGPGTSAIHTWPTYDVYGTASSEGCIRVPPDALERLTEVPLGTLVLVDEHS